MRMRFCSADAVCGNGGSEFFCISCYILEVFPFVSWCCSSLLPFVLGSLPVITFMCFSSVLLNFCRVFLTVLASVVLFQPFLLIGFCFVGLAHDFKFVVSTRTIWICLLALSWLPFKCLTLCSYICKLILNLLHLPLQSDVSG